MNLAVRGCGLSRRAIDHGREGRKEGRTWVAGVLMRSHAICAKQWSMCIHEIHRQRLHVFIPRILDLTSAIICYRLINTVY